MVSREWWLSRYALGNYDYFRDGKTAELGRYGIVCAFLRQWQGQGVMVDLGCGAGVLGRFVEGVQGIKYIGIDYLYEILQKMREYLPGNFRVICADMRACPIREGSVAVVVFNESLYYVDNYTEVFEESFKWIRPNGLVIVSMFETPLTRRMWKTFTRIRPPTERLLVRSLLGREPHTWEVAYWTKSTRGGILDISNK